MGKRLLMLPLIHGSVAARLSIATDGLGLEKTHTIRTF
jgi:hypothetical protein